jgi:hypothetical protein
MMAGRSCIILRTGGAMNLLNLAAAVFRLHRIGARAAIVFDHENRDDSPGAPIISTTASSLDKPLEILGSVVDALPGIARAAVLLHPHTLADDSIGTLHEVSQIRRAGVRNSFEHVHLIRTAGRAIRAIPKDTGDRS